MSLLFVQLLYEIEESLCYSLGEGVGVGAGGKSKKNHVGTAQKNRSQKFRTVKNGEQ